MMDADRTLRDGATPSPSKGDPPPCFSDLWCADRAQQGAALEQVMALLRDPVAWAGAVWDDVRANLAHRDHHNRAIAAQVMSALARNVPASRLLADFDALYAVTCDARFVTARHGLQSFWKVGHAGDQQKAALVAALQRRFVECEGAKNCTLIRADIIEVLRRLYDAEADPWLPSVATALIGREPDARCRARYRRLWPARGGRG